eukprot:1145039-Pelagomonas_calceolata.AAC.9
MEQDSRDVHPLPLYDAHKDVPTYYLTYGPMKARFTEDIWRIVNWDQLVDYKCQKGNKKEIGKTI